jgi:hypothetical protein
MFIVLPYYYYLDVKLTLLNTYAKDFNNFFMQGE